jgi:hypothetical protein
MLRGGIGKSMSENGPTVYVCDEVRQVERLHRDLFTEEFRQLPIREQLDRQAQRIWEAHQSGNPAMVTHVKCWHPDLVGHSADEIMNCDFTRDDAREVMAREYGYLDWNDASERGTQPPDPIFEAAVDALVDGDVQSLQRLLDQDRSLVHQRSRFGHEATLLHYVGSNGVETYRQKVPPNLPEVAQLLLDAGADVNALANMYGGSTVIALLVTSEHPAQAGVVDDVVQVLLDAGAEAE